MVHRGPEESAEIPKMVLDILESKRIITKRMHLGAMWYELAHDRLIKPIIESNQERSYSKRRFSKYSSLGKIVMIGLSTVLVCFKNNSDSFYRNLIDIIISNCSI
jgi:hypothetical protein